MDASNKKNIIFLSISTAALAGMLFFAILPSISNIKTIAQEIGAEIENLELRSSEGQSIEKNINNLNEVKKSNEIKNSFVLRNEEVAFIKELEEVARKLNLDQSINIDEATKASKKKNKDADKEMPVTIKLKGDYYSLLNYLAFLERGSYYVNINSLSFGKIGGSSASVGNIIKPSSMINIDEEPEIMSTQLNFTIKATVYRREV